MIKYIINTPYGSKVFKINNDTYESKINNLSIIKKICIENLFTYEGYTKSVSKIFNIRHNIPVYLNDNQMFIPTKRVRDYENIWINYASILTFKSYDSNIEIIFKDYDKLKINLKYRLFDKRIKHLETIQKYLNNRK